MILMRSLIVAFVCLMFTPGCMKLSEVKYSDGKWPELIGSGQSSAVVGVFGFNAREMIQTGATVNTGSVHGSSTTSGHATGTVSTSPYNTANLNIRENSDTTSNAFAVSTSQQFKAVESDMDLMAFKYAVENTKSFSKVIIGEKADYFIEGQAGSREHVTVIDTIEQILAGVTLTAFFGMPLRASVYGHGYARLYDANGKFIDSVECEGYASGWFVFWQMREAEKIAYRGIRKAIIERLAIDICNKFNASVKQ